MRFTAWVPLTLTAACLTTGCITNVSPAGLADLSAAVNVRSRPSPPTKPAGGNATEDPAPEEDEETSVVTVEPLPRKAPRPSAVPVPVILDDCTRNRPAGDPVRGGPMHGRYNGQSLPDGYNKFNTEAQITELIRREEGSPNWACFQKLFPGAATIYLQLKARTGFPSPTPTAWGGPGPFPSVGVSAPPITGKTVIVSGTVYDEAGATVNGATVTVKSLDSAVPYTATVTTTEGSYVVNNVPEGANVEVVVTKAGYTSRRRVQSFQTSTTGAKNILDFGGGSEGSAHFISDYPEIAMTSPQDLALNVDPTRVAFKVTLSEALDEDSRYAFDNAFAIVPGNAEAARLPTGNAGPFIDVRLLEAGDSSLGNVTAGGFAHVLRRNASFLGSVTNRVRSTWNAAGTEVTYTFDGTLQAAVDEAAVYQAVLFTPANPIEDFAGNRLGTNADGTFAWPAQGMLLCNAFRDADLVVDPQTRGSAWAQTHTSAATFSVKRDEVDPKLTGVAVVEDGNDLRLELTFSEPMAAYAGDGQGVVDPSVYNLANYSFMLGLRSGDVSFEDLAGDAPAVPVGPIASMKAALQPLREFQFSAGPNAPLATGGNLQANPNAAVAIEVEPDAPNLVNLWIRNGSRDGLFDSYRTIKARVGGVKDPAGNNITPTDADKNLAMATI